MMKSRGIKDLYLPAKLAYHVKIFLSSVLVTIFYSMIWTGKAFHEGFWYMFGAVFVQMEFALWIAFKYFKNSTKSPSVNYAKKITTRLLIFFGVMLVLALVIVFINLSIERLIHNYPFTEMVQNFFKLELKNLLISWGIGIGIGSVLFFYFEWNSALKREQKLKEEKLIFQYKTLKNQVNPHFLFNSLNTLSSLVSTNAQLAEQFIARFATIYRYVLDNNEVELISLTDEMKFVNDYFFLQKIRDNGKIDLITALGDTDQYLVLPISVQVLLENALKHNAATQSTPLRILISKVGDYLEVSNNIQPKRQAEPSAKIGLKNLNERLQHITNRPLIVESDQQTFKVKVPLVNKIDFTPESINK